LRRRYTEEEINAIIERAMRNRRADVFIDRTRGRDSVSVRINRSIHEAFSTYCRFVDITLGEFYEAAGLLFIEMNPADGFTIHEEG